MMSGTIHLQTILAFGPAIGSATREVIGFLGSVGRGVIGGGLVGFAALAPMLPLAAEARSANQTEKQDA